MEDEEWVDHRVEWNELKRKGLEYKRMEWGGVEWSKIISPSFDFDRLRRHRVSGW